MRSNQIFTSVYGEIIYLNSEDIRLYPSSFFNFELLPLLYKNFRPGQGFFYLTENQLQSLGSLNKSYSLKSQNILINLLISTAPNKIENLLEASDISFALLDSPTS